MWNTKAVALTIQKLLARLKFLESWSKVKGQGHKVKIVCSQEKALSHKIFMWSTKALALIVQKLLGRLLFKKD